MNKVAHLQVGFHCTYTLPLTPGNISHFLILQLKKCIVGRATKTSIAGLMGHVNFGYFWVMTSTSTQYIWP